MSTLMAEKCNSLSHFVDIVYSCFLIMYCIVSYCVLCLYLICYLYTNVSTKVTRNKDIYIFLQRKSIFLNNNVDTSI
jgi:hypothetical protein